MLARSVPAILVLLFLAFPVADAQPRSTGPGEISVTDWVQLDAGRQLAYVSGALDMLRRGGILVLGTPVCSIWAISSVTPPWLHDRLAAYLRADSTPANRPMAEAIIDVLKKDCPRQ